MIKQLDLHITDLERLGQERVINIDEIKQCITENYQIFQKKINETSDNVRDIDQHVHSILSVAKDTVDMIEAEEKKEKRLEQALTDPTIRSRMLHIDQIQFENLRKECKLKSKVNMMEEVNLDPYVIFKLTDETIETKKIYKSDPNPCWDKLNIELQAIDDGCNDEYNKLVIEVWDDFSLNLSNEHLCTGSISFSHLDMLKNRGPVVTTVELFDSDGTFVCTAKVNITVFEGAATELFGISTSTSTHTTIKAKYEIGDEVLCNYGGEGEWLAGKIIRFKKIRDRLDTRRLYEIEYANGDLEVNVPISRLKDAVRSKKQPVSPSRIRHGETQEVRTTIITMTNFYSKSYLVLICYRR